jgi:hypothetical protein
MAPSLAVGWTIAFAVLLFVLLRTHAVRIAIAAWNGDPFEALPPDEEEEQKPETDRAPRRFAWLPVTVAALAVVRAGLLVALHR